MSSEVTFYIPAYNAEKTIEKSINSILNQKLTVDEIIIVDDCSRDNTNEIIKKYKNIKLLRNDKNMGLGYNRNLAIKNSKNNIIASIDADVEIDENWLYELHGKIINSNISMCGGKMIEKFTNKPANAWRSKYYSQNWGDKNNENPPFLYGCNTLIKKDFWRKVNGYNENLKTNGEDVEFSNKVKSLKNSNLFYSSKATCYHLQNDNLDSLSKRVWRYHSFAYKIKKPSKLKLIKLTIKQFKFMILRILENLIKFNLFFMWISFVVFIKFVNNEIKHLIDHK